MTIEILEKRLALAEQIYLNVISLDDQNYYLKVVQDIKRQIRDLNENQD